MFEYYEKTDAKELVCIFEKCIMNGCIDEVDVYKLLEILPKIISRRRSLEITETSQQQSFDWQEYICKKQFAFRQEISKLYQSLSKWVFLHNAVYKKNMEDEDYSIKKYTVDDNVNGVK